MLARRMVAICAWLFLACVDPSAAQSQTWKKHTYASDGFEVEFSGEVTANPTQLSAETQKKVVRAIQYMQDGGDFVFAVAYSLNKDGVNFEEGSKSSFAALKCKFTTRDEPLMLPGGRGRELSGTDCHDGTLRAQCRYFSTGNWFYQVITLFKDNRGNEDNARHFLQSFKLIAR